MTKEKAYAKYILLCVSFISIVLGVLVITNIINPKYSNGEVIDNNMRILIGVVFVLCGIFSGISSIKEIVKAHNISNYSCYFKFKNEYSLDKIKEYFTCNELDESKVYLDENDNEGITIGYKNLIGEFTCYISKEEVIIIYDYTDEYYDKKSDEEIEKLPLINDEVKFSSLKIDVNNILNEFIKFIKSNEFKLEGLE